MTVTDFTVRAVEEADAESIAALLNPIIEAGAYTILSEPVSVADQVDFIRGFPERGIYLAAVENDTRRVVGIQDVTTVSSDERALRHVGEISTFVRLDARRSGIGRALADAMFLAAHGRGLTKLLATIRADNPHAVAFYESLGFRHVGTLRDHALTRGRYVDEVLMEALLGSTPPDAPRAFDSRAHPA